MPFTPLSSGQQQGASEREGTYLNPPEMMNHLLMVWPVRYEADVYTKYPRQDGRPSDAVFVDVVDLSVADDYGQPGKVMRQARWTQGRLIRDTKHAIGVGRDDALLVQMSKDGDAYQLIEQSANPGSVQMAEWWLSAHPQFQPGMDAPRPQQEYAPQPQYQQYQNQAPPVSAPPQPLSPQQSAMDRLRRQAGVQPQPQTQYGPAQPPLPPPPPPAPPMAGFPEEEPPF
jgi:hypothetical protein